MPAIDPEKCPKAAGKPPVENSVNMREFLHFRDLSAAFRLTNFGAIEPFQRPPFPSQSPNSWDSPRPKPTGSGQP